MPSNPARTLHGDAADSTKPDSKAEYNHLRDKLERLMAEPVNDFAAIDQLVDHLEQLQLAIKAEHGIVGNNPNE